MQRHLAPLQSIAFWRGVFVFVLLSLFVAAPISASINGMGGKVEICSGFGTKWIDIDDGASTHSQCDDCVATAPLVLAILAPNRTASLQIFAYERLAQVSLIGSILNPVSNKDPPLI